MFKSRYQPLACVLSIFTMMLGVSLCAPPTSSQSLGIAAVVNDDVISLYDLEARLDLHVWAHPPHPAEWWVDVTHHHAWAGRYRTGGQVPGKVLASSG